MPPDQLKCAFHQHQAGTSLFPFLFVWKEGKGEQTMSIAIPNWTVSNCVSVPTWLSCTTVGSHGTGDIVSHTSVFFKPMSPQQQALGFTDLLCPYLCLIVEGRDFPPLAGEYLGAVSYSISSEARSAEQASGRQQPLGLRRMSQGYEICAFYPLCNTIFLPCAFFLSSSVKEEPKNYNYQTEKGTYISSTQRPLFADIDLPSEKASWHPWKKLPVTIPYFMPFLLYMKKEENWEVLCKFL